MTEEGKVLNVEDDLGVLYVFVLYFFPFIPFSSLLPRW